MSTSSQVQDDWPNYSNKQKRRETLKDQVHEIECPLDWMHNNDLGPVVMTLPSFLTPSQSPHFKEVNRLLLEKNQQTPEDWARDIEATLDWMHNNEMKPDVEEGLM